MFDVLSSMVLPMPYFTMLASFFLVFIEAKSVLEKAHEKDRRKMNKSIKELAVLLEHKDDVLKGITELLKEKEKEEKEDESNN